jgi:hypothetical protein
MHPSRTAGLLAALLVVGLLSASTATAQTFEETGFVVAVAEPSDTPPQPVGGYDLTEVALGEPGDGTVVFRGTLAEAPESPADGVLYFGFSAEAGDVVGGCTYAGAPDTRNIGEPIAPDSCLVSGAVFYATYSYDTIDAAIGDTITQIWGFTDMCAPAGCLPGDTAPGGIANQGWPATTFGTDYTLTGCTKTGGCGASPGGGGSGPALDEPIFVNLTAPTLSQTFTKASNGTYIYSATGPADDVDVLYNATPASGSVSIVVEDASGAEVVNTTVSETQEGQERVSSGGSGVWTFRLTYSNFTGNVNIELAKHQASLVGSQTTTTTQRATTSNDDDRTGTFPLVEDKDTPMPGAAPLVLAILALAFILVRRRLA